MDRLLGESRRHRLALCHITRAYPDNRTSECGADTPVRQLQNRASRSPGTKTEYSSKQIGTTGSRGCPRYSSLVAVSLRLLARDSRRRSRKVIGSALAFRPVRDD